MDPLEDGEYYQVRNLTTKASLSGPSVIEAREHRLILFLSPSTDTMLSEDTGGRRGLEFERGIMVSGGVLVIERKGKGS